MSRPAERRDISGRSLTRHRDDESGAVAIFASLVAVVLLFVCSFVVDIGMTWERRGELQQQADEAAIFAAEALPATDPESRMRVAKRAAFFIACNRVLGQVTLHPHLPSCPDSASATSLDAYAQELLDEGLVSFPSSTQVQVITPDSQVDFAFAGITGVDETIQEKAAIAKVSSPGGVLPIGLSLQCVASIVNNAGLGSRVDGVLPLSYVTPGSFSDTGPLDGTDEPAFEPWETAYSGGNASGSVTVANPALSGSTLTLDVSSPGLVPTLQDVTGGDEVVFKRGGVTVGPVGATSVSASTGTLVAQVPDEVVGTPGVWHVKVRLFTGSVLGLGLVGTNPRWSESDVTFVVHPSQETLRGRLVAALDDVLNLRDFLACGRLLDSPRVGDAGTPALTRNLQEGLDHGLTRNDALVQALGSQDLSLLDGSASRLHSVLSGSVANVLGNPTYGLLGCTGSTYNRLDSVETWQATQSVGSPPANCVRISSEAATEQEFTDGLLKDSPSSGSEPGFGRLSCSRQGACEDATTTLTGFSGSYNNDSFADFVRDDASGALDGNLAFALDTYLLPGLPVITPSDSLEEELYRSPRFGWVPVLSYFDLNTAGSVDYPILTFRPLFLDNGTAPDLEIAGLDPNGVVDDLGCHLRDAVDQTVAELEASLGLLTGALPGLLGGLDPVGISQQLCAGQVDQGLHALGSALGTDLGREEAGLVVQDGRLKAARFMTIAPEALPPVTTEYDGPLTDYLGVGPKIIRLVR